MLDFQYFQNKFLVTNVKKAIANYDQSLKYVYTILAQ